MTKKWILPVLFCCLISKPSANSNPLSLAEYRTLELTRDSHSSGEEKKAKSFSKNPLLLDGIALDYSFFSLTSRGKLAVVAGDPNSPDAVKVPFRAYLRRDGKRVNMGKADVGCAAAEVELADVLAAAHVGDELVIEPTRKEDVEAKRVIRLKLFWFLKLPFNKGDGC